MVNKEVKFTEEERDLMMDVFTVMLKRVTTPNIVVAWLNMTFENMEKTRDTFSELFNIVEVESEKMENLGDQEFFNEFIVVLERLKDDLAHITSVDDLMKKARHMRDLSD